MLTLERGLFVCRVDVNAALAPLRVVCAASLLSSLSLLWVTRNESGCKFYCRVLLLGGLFYFSCYDGRNTSRLS